MNLGPNAEDVKEVVEIFRKVIRNGTFSSQEPEDTSNLEEAKQSAWEEEYGPEGLTWADIRSEQMSTVWDSVYSNDMFSEIETDVQTVADELSILAVEKFRGSELHDIAEDVLADASNCIYARAVLGRDQAFFEELLTVYKRGLWPCGWVGEYPDGRIKTFRPTL